MCFVWKASGKVCLILWDELKFQVGYRIFKTLSSNAPQCALFIFFLLVQRQTILLINGEALHLNGLINHKI
jgi:hypothetical protein